MIKFALPIIAQHPFEVLELINLHRDRYELFEVWFDYLPTEPSELIERLEHELGSRAIVLLRRLNLEPMRLSEKQRFELLDRLLPLNLRVDLDLLDQRGELARYGRRLGARLIVSYHDYSHTPKREELFGLVERMCAFDRATVKIACMCHDFRDALRLLEIDCYLTELGRKHVVLGMGRYGTITRIAGPLLGSEIAYAPTEVEHSSAAGQIPLNSLKQILTKVLQTEGLRA